MYTNLDRAGNPKPSTPNFDAGELVAEEETLKFWALT
jgi:hypothetical protein